MRILPEGVRPRDLLTAMGVGGLSAAAFPPVGLWPLAPVSAALLLVVLRDRTPAAGRVLGLFYGLASAAGTMYWLFHVFGAPAIALLLVYAAYFALLGTLVGLTRGHSPFARAAVAALFALGVEWLRGDAWYLRFPWYTAPHALAAEPACIYAAKWVGAYGLSYLVWFIAGQGAFGRLWAWALVLLLPLCQWINNLGVRYESENRRVALVVQAEAPRDSVEMLFNQIPVPAEGSEPVDLVVMPEYSYFQPYEKAMASPTGPAAYARRFRAPTVVGALIGDYDSPSFRNVAVVLDDAAQVVGTFTKQHPVPLMADGVPGTERPVFRVSDEGTLGVAICYDFDSPGVAASLVRSGATVLAAPTFDVMSWTRMQHVHHELLLRLRAVENGRWIVRAASSGRSESIDPLGRPSEAGAEIGTRGWALVPFAHRSDATPGSYADFLGPAAGALSAVVLVGYAIAAFRRRPRDGNLLDGGPRSA